MTERWTLDYYFVMEEYFQQVHHRTHIELPAGYYKKAKAYIKETGGGWNGNQGVLWRVREWGAELFHFDMLTADQSDIFLPPNPKDLGETYIIGSEEHPFRIYAPNGELMGTYDTAADYRFAVDTLLRKLLNRPYPSQMPRKRVQ